LRHIHIPRSRMTLPHSARIQGDPPCAVVNRDDGTPRIAILQGGTCPAGTHTAILRRHFRITVATGPAKPFASIFQQLPSIMAASDNELPNDFRHLLSATFGIAVTTRPIRATQSASGGNRCLIERSRDESRIRRVGARRSAAWALTRRNSKLARQPSRSSLVERSIFADHVNAAGPNYVKPHS
jgi:hypothetical protein